jgi:hypothetical protein
MSSYEASNASLSYARMVNAAGAIVSPTQTAVQAAMTYYRSSIDSGKLAPALACVWRCAWHGHACASLTSGSAGQPHTTGHLTVDILNANSSTAWPMSYISFALIPQNTTSLDCTNIRELLLFISWYASLTEDERQRPSGRR